MYNIDRIVTEPTKKFKSYLLEDSNGLLIISSNLPLNPLILQRTNAPVNIVMNVRKFTLIFVHLFKSN